MNLFLKKIYNDGIVKVIFLIFPIIELITSISLRAEIRPAITIGAAYKAMLLIYFSIYIIFVNKNKKTLFITIFTALAIFCVLNTFLTIENFTLSVIAGKTTQISKFIAFPIYMLFLVAYLKNGGALDAKYLATAGTIYTILILIPHILGISLPSRIYTQYGIKGLFNSGNEIGIIITIAYPIVLYNVIKNTSISSLLGFGIVNYASLNVGVKTSLLGVIATLVIAICYSIYLLLTKEKTKFKKVFSIAFITLILIGILLPVTPVYKYMVSAYNNNLDKGGENVAESMLFSGREKKLRMFYEEFNKLDAIHKFLGMNDQSKPKINNSYILAERDFHDIMFSYGYVGISIYVAFILYFILPIGIYIIKNLKHSITLYNIMLGVTMLLGLISAYLVGHTFASPTVTLYLSLIISIFYCKSKNYTTTAKKPSVMFICSVGGHLTQMLQIKQIFNNYNYVLITEKTDITKNMKKKYNIRYLIHGTRKYMLKYIFIELFNVFKSMYYYTIFSPEIIVTTGTHTAVPMCYISKFFGKKVIFIESFAKRTSPTKSGKLVYKIADTFVIQWESLKEVYPKAEIWGWIY